MNAMTALWTGLELIAALRRRAGAHAARRQRRLHRQPHLEADDLFFAIRGENHDGHDFVATRLRSRRGGGCGRTSALSNSQRSVAFASWTTARRMERLGARGARAIEGEDRRRHRFGRQDQHQGDAARDAAACGADPCFGRFLQQSLGRAADAGAHAGDARFGVFEIGMNHAGEIAPLTRWCVRTWRSMTTSRRCIIEHLGSIEAIADAKAEIFLGLEPAERGLQRATRRNSSVSKSARGSRAAARVLTLWHAERTASARCSRSRRSTTARA